MDIYTLEELASATRNRGDRFHEFLRRESMSAGMYILPGGGIDEQSPHNEDEVYVVARGTGWIRVADDDQPVGPGSVIFVAAGVDHRFHDFSDDLEILVLFAPAYSG